jgi:hypothetical protein
MSNPKTPTKKRSTIKAIALVGVLLLIAGIGLWLYTDSVIKGLEQMLSDPNLTQNQRDRFEGSLAWWRDTKVHGYGILSIVLVAIGLCALEYSIIYVMVQPQ